MAPHISPPSSLPERPFERWSQTPSPSTLSQRVSSRPWPSQCDTSLKGPHPANLLRWLPKHPSPQEVTELTVPRHRGMSPIWPHPGPFHSGCGHGTDERAVGLPHLVDLPVAQDAAGCAQHQPAGLLLGCCWGSLPVPLRFSSWVLANHGQVLVLIGLGAAGGEHPCGLEGAAAPEPAQLGCLPSSVQEA